MINDINSSLNFLPVASLFTISGGILAYKVQGIVSSRMYNQYKEQFQQWKDKHPTAYWITGLTLHLAKCTLAVSFGAVLSEAVGFNVSTYATAAFIALPFVVIEGVKFARKVMVSRLASDLNLPPDAQKTLSAILENPQEAAKELASQLGLGEKELKSLLENPQEAAKELGSQLGLGEEEQNALLENPVGAVQALQEKLGIKVEGENVKEKEETPKDKEKSALQEEIKKLEVARNEAARKVQFLLKDPEPLVVDVSRLPQEKRAQLEDLQKDMQKLAEVDISSMSKAKKKLWENQKGVHKEKFKKWVTIWFSGVVVEKAIPKLKDDIYEGLDKITLKEFQLFIEFAKKLFKFQIHLENFKKSVDFSADFTFDEMAILQQRKVRMEREIQQFNDQLKEPAEKPSPDKSRESDLLLLCQKVQGTVDTFASCVGEVEKQEEKRQLYTDFQDQFFPLKQALFDAEWKYEPMMVVETDDTITSLGGMRKDLLTPERINAWHFKYVLLQKLKEFYKIILDKEVVKKV